MNRSQTVRFFYYQRVFIVQLFVRSSNEQLDKNIIDDTDP